MNPMKDQISGYDVTAKISMGDVSTVRYSRNVLRGYLTSIIQIEHEFRDLSVEEADLDVN